MTRLDAVAVRIGGRWFVPRSRIEAITAQISEQAATERRLVAHIADIEQRLDDVHRTTAQRDVVNLTETELRTRIEGLELALASLTEQTRDAMKDLLDRSNGITRPNSG